MWDIRSDVQKGQHRFESSFLNYNHELHSINAPELSWARLAISLDLHYLPPAVVVARSDPKIGHRWAWFLATSLRSNLLYSLKIQQSLQTECHTVALRSWKWLWTISFTKIIGSTPLWFTCWSQGCQKPLAKETATVVGQRLLDAYVVWICTVWT